MDWEALMATTDNKTTEYRLDPVINISNTGFPLKEWQLQSKAPGQLTWYTIWNFESRQTAAAALKEWSAL